MTKSQKPRKRGPIAIERAAERDVMASKVAATGGRTRMIKLDHITVPPDRMRQLRSDLIDELAESIKQQGQLQPIIVRPQDFGYALTAGRHRLEAVRKLGHEEIECRVLEGFGADQTS